MDKNKTIVGFRKTGVLAPEQADRIISKLGREGIEALLFMGQALLHGLSPDERTLAEGMGWTMLRARKMLAKFERLGLISEEPEDGAVITSITRLCEAYNDSRLTAKVKVKR